MYSSKSVVFFAIVAMAATTTATKKPYRQVTNTAADASLRGNTRANGYEATAPAEGQPKKRHRNRRLQDYSGTNPPNCPPGFICLPEIIPSATPSAYPSEEPSRLPSMDPTLSPTEAPRPSDAPTAAPSVSARPSETPTAKPVTPTPAPLSIVLVPVLLPESGAINKPAITEAPTISSAPTAFVPQCKVKRNKESDGDFVDVLSAIDAGWIEAEYTGIVKSVVCSNCNDMEFVDCHNVECISKGSCTGSIFFNTGTYKQPEDFSNVYCIGEKSCEGASFKAVDRIACIGKNSCSSNLIGSSDFFDVSYVQCEGEHSCIGASFGSTDQEIEEVICAGTESCLFAESFAVKTMACNGTRSCKESRFFRDTKTVLCQGDTSCDQSESTGPKSIKCGTPNSCTGLEWL